MSYSVGLIINWQTSQWIGNLSRGVGFPFLSGIYSTPSRFASRRIAISMTAVMLMPRRSANRRRRRSAVGDMMILVFLFMAHSTTFCGMLSTPKRCRAGHYIFSPPARRDFDTSRTLWPRRALFGAWFLSGVTSPHVSVGRMWRRDRLSSRADQRRVAAANGLLSALGLE